MRELQLGKEIIGRDNHNAQTQNINGIGTHAARIPNLEWKLAQAMYGDDCWLDPDFMRAYIRDNPHVRVATKFNTNGSEIVRNG